MTNEELRRLCERYTPSYHNAMSETYRDCHTLATETLRLLDENEAMRGVVDAVRNLDGKVITIHDGEEAAGQYYTTRISEINKLYKALFQLDELVERT